ncbi:MAG: hypothetical protein LBK58_16100 [Prevotellaceae bacterium]|jgi:hypothetical protein|nr:hypothetical protein [Prevotellaceae bacterium]
MIVTATEEIRSFFPNTTFKDFTKFKAFMDSATLSNLLPVLGTPLFDELSNKYKDRNSTPLSPDYERLLSFSQRTVVLFGIWEALPSLNVTINESGGLTVTDNQNTVPASRDRFLSLLEATKRQAYDAVDFLLEYLENNSVKFMDASNEQLWKKSEFYFEQTGLLIFTAIEMEQAGVHLENKRRQFIEIRPMLRTVQNMYIAPPIGEETVTSLIKRKMDNLLTAADKKVLPLLQTALAFYTASHDKTKTAGNTHGMDSLEYAQWGSQHLEKAMQLMRGDVANYPDFPANRTTAAQTKPAALNQEAFFLLGGEPVKRTV